ncbi:MAG: alanine--glyoxylate aminotransferase family protein [Synergistaceae bacterium]|nr:alanine--glyoxylate aminotransferase family protein [Synergistaceae bacterium]MBQ6115432.1 alanine--glyoxylate aminotransferase family protein [Synergistaceae bacterium]MBQ6418724.1 alanine--glyoxylate aminotransferase family protein [Synergistaceae bacterium]MBR0247449.1 alanine--glyoxylate aminotransferase family protein [Synergistaceae bacterium]
MESYRIGLIPGPVSVPEEIRKAWLNDYASSDLEDEFFTLYRDNQALTQKLLHTKNDIVITSGEAMSILWAALKCTLKAGEKVLAVSSGLFGEGFADMARAFGAEAEICAFPYDGIPEAEKVREHAKRYRPKVITAVHCETPSGTLTPCLEEIGRIAREVGAIFVVDFVSSVGGAELDVDACGIDIGLLGSQKVLSLTPCLSVSSISSRAWEVIADVNYSGYESYLGWKKIPAEHYMPYTHDWQAMKALNISLNMIMREGMEAAFKRHDMAARLCRDMGREMGLKLYPKSENICSPTVTAFYVPEKFTWPEFDGALRAKGLAIGGNYGSLAGKVFRIGHMGSQADCDLVREGMNVIREVLQ